MADVDPGDAARRAAGYETLRSAIAALPETNPAR
jgi:hypothetical protein